MSAPEGMTCREVAEEATAYLERALAPADQARFEDHCVACPRCRVQLVQWQAMVASLASLQEPSMGATRTEKEELATLFREQGFHRPGRPDPRIPLGLGNELAAAGDHIAYFWESEREFLATVGFVAAGATQGETCILLGHDEANDRLESAMRRAGLDAAALKRQDRLRFVSEIESADAVLEEIAQYVKLAVDAGAPLVRILGNLGWGRPEWLADREILRLEARVTDSVRKFPVVVICNYDVGAVPGRKLFLGGLECHPLTYRRGALRLNELYVPADRFLTELPPDLE